MEPFGEIYDVKLNTEDFINLKDQTLRAISEFRPRPWNEELVWYSGLSLFTDPQYPHHDELQSTLGPLPEHIEHYKDSTRFTKPTIVGERFLWFTDKIPLIPVKGRIAIVSGKTGKEAWHQDEDIKDVLRLNIPIINPEGHYIQLEDKKPIIFKEGYCYTWDTGKYHRIISENNSMRISLVLGFINEGLNIQDFRKVSWLQRKKS